ncbi:MAG: ATP-binding protein, partial [Oleiharenicola lentus]
SLPHALPQSVIAFVARSKKRVIMENAAMDATFAVDPYVARTKPKSVLCLPILRQGEPSGILYLENNLLAGVFTAGKLEILELMASQAAISLENARLYEGLRREYSERKQVEEQLRHSQKMDALGTLAAGIAHDFNNLLTGILGNASLARLELPPASLGQPMIDQIEIAARRAADLCKQMLAYSGKGRFVIQRVDLNKLIEDTTHLLQISIAKNCVLRFNLTPALPAVSADATQLRQVIMNLVINASEAIASRSGVLVLATGVARVDEEYLRGFRPDASPAPGDYVYVEVSDNGCGMDAATLGKIFDPFFTTKFTGRGLGLAAVLGIVRGHKGGLKVYSEVGK